MLATELFDVRTSKDPGVLRSITQEDCNLTIWERDPPRDMALLLDAPRENIRFRSQPSELVSAFAQALPAHGYGPSYAREKLIEDVTDLSELFSSIVRATTLELRLEVVSTDSCRRFHKDFVRARLITTYVGRGTQWLDRDDAERVANDQEPRVIRSLGAGDVGIFKGRLGTTRPAIHRSPPIEGTGEQRLLLVIDPFEEEQWALK